MRRDQEKDKEIVELDLDEVYPTDSEPPAAAIDLNLDVGEEDAGDISPPLTLNERVTALEKKMTRVITLLEYLAATVEAWKDEML